MKRILVLDDNLTVCLMLKSWLVKKGYEAASATSVAEAKTMIKDKPFDLILSDIRMPETDGFTFLSWLQKYDSSILVIMMTSFSDVETAVESMKKGAVDYIAKPIDPNVFFKKIEEVFESQHHKSEIEKYTRIYVKPPLDKYKVLVDKFDSLSEQTEPLLILGEHGTGKFSVAYYIYEKGYGYKKPFIQYDDYQQEKDFGYKSDEEKLVQNLREQLVNAENGVLFIREIGQLTKPEQNELLDYFARKKTNTIPVRVIASSSLNNGQLQEKLLPKLYTLFNENRLLLSSLKGEKEEILFFANYFLKYANLEFGKDVQRISSEFVDKLLTHTWPGNIQELKNIIFKAVLISEGSEIKASLIPELFGAPKKEQAVNKEQTVILESLGQSLTSLKKENYERAIIQEALEIAKGNKTLAANILNIDRKTLYNKIKNYGLESQN